MSVIVGRALPDVRDGLKPVHRRVLYAMYDNGYRPDRGYVKSARRSPTPWVTTTPRRQLHLRHPRANGAAVVAALPARRRPGQLRFPRQRRRGRDALHRVPDDAAGHGDGPRDRPRHSRFRPELRRQDAGATVLPSRIPTCSSTVPAASPSVCSPNIPPHNLREARRGHLLGARQSRGRRGSHPRGRHGTGQGTGIPTRPHRRRQGHPGRPYRTGRGSIRMRGSSRSRSRSRLHPDRQHELPYQVNPDNLITSIAEQVRDGKIDGISKIEDRRPNPRGHAHRPSSSSVTPSRRSCSKTSPSNRSCRTSSARTCCLIVDGVPRTLRLDQMIRYYVAHQLESSSGATCTCLRKAEERAQHPARHGQGPEALDEVIALIRSLFFWRRPYESTRTGLMDLLTVDEIRPTRSCDAARRWPRFFRAQKIMKSWPRSSASRRSQGHREKTRAAALRSSRTSCPRSSRSNGDDPPAPDHRRRRRRHRRGPHRPRGRGRHDHRDG